MSFSADISQLITQGNINFIIIRNSQKPLKYEEYIDEALNLYNRMSNCDNLNMNILFIHNILQDASRTNDSETYEIQSYEADKNKALNSNINIIILKNILDIRRQDL